jgi:ribosomal protein S18 acetylase RimI-like enzyme
MKGIKALMFNWIVRIFKGGSSGISHPAEDLSSPIELSRPDVPRHMSPTPRQGGFQAATMDDADFIFDSILQGARSGHFNEEYLHSNQGLRIQIHNSISLGRCPTHRGGASTAFMYVYAEDSRTIGFSWVVKTQRRDEWELYMMAVARDCRRRGVGEKIVCETIQRLPGNAKVLARVYRASDIMLRVLLKMGFKRSTVQRQRDAISLSYARQ